MLLCAQLDNVIMMSFSIDVCGVIGHGVQLD